MSLPLNCRPEPSELGILSSLKKSPLCFVTEASGGCFAMGDHVRMCQSDGSGQGWPPSTLCACPSASGGRCALKSSAPWQEDYLLFPVCCGRGLRRRAEAEQLAGLRMLLNGELGVLPESGSLVLVFLHPSHIPASCIHLRYLPETFPGEKQLPRA